VKLLGLRGAATADPMRTPGECERCGGLGEIEDAQLSQHFALSEWLGHPHHLVEGGPAVPNDPSIHHVERARFTARTLLDPLREEFGIVVVTSGYRCDVLDVLADSGNDKWMRERSAHQTGSAFDVCASDSAITIRDLVRFFARSPGLQWDQIIPEGGCLHVAAEAPYPLDKPAGCGPQRRQLMVRTVSRIWEAWQASGRPWPEPHRWAYETFDDSEEQHARIA
jgi:hypothetical protein